MLVFLWTSVDWSQVTGGSRTVVGEINGVKVQLAMYNQAVQSALEERQRTSGRSLTSEEVEEVRNQVWSQLVAQFSFEREFRSGHNGPVRRDALPSFRVATEAVPSRNSRRTASSTSASGSAGSVQCGAQYLPTSRPSTTERSSAASSSVVTGDVYVSMPACGGWRTPTRNHHGGGGDHPL
jgi:hypothetical protein